MIGEPATDRTESRQRLREMLTRLQNETRRKIKDLRQHHGQEFGAEPANVIHPANATGAIETRAALIAQAEEKLRHLDEAFARLDAGEYSRCLKCAGVISIERLLAIPFASYCHHCQRRINRERGGWGHAPYDDQWDVV